MTERLTGSTWTMELGATLVDHGVEFSVWAPNATLVEVAIEPGPDHIDGMFPLTRGTDGMHCGLVSGVGAGARYRYRLDGGDAFPDPCSRFQPDGPHGPSEVVDPNAYVWGDDAWPGLTPDAVVIYECHIGTYTPEGTYDALIAQLPELKRLGVTAIELMPVAECPGRWNWGYDGVCLFAPSHNYGRPEDLKRLVDAAHRRGLGVLLDVVYNHLGPDGNYLGVFATEYFTDRHKTLWGDAINYDGPGSEHVREFMIANACYWLSEYHFDGLRMDATDAIVDDSPVHILAELTTTARASVAPKPVVLYAEEARNEVRTIRAVDQGGYGVDGVWADDLHHEIRVFLTGSRGNYLDNYEGSTADIARTLNEGFLYQGQVEKTTGKPRGTVVTDEPATTFLVNIQNHDQVGNRAYGERLHHEIDHDRYHVASALLLFSPFTPVLFMGQEFAASASFMFFTDHEPELGKLVTEGRREEFKGFPAFSNPLLRESIPDPQADETFARSKLNLAERGINVGTYDLYRELLRLRRTDPVLVERDRTRTKADAIGAQVVTVARWVGDEYRLLVANFGPSTGIPLADHPTLAALPGEKWRLLLTTSERRFRGGNDRCGLTGQGERRRLEMPARTAAVFAFQAV